MVDETDDPANPSLEEIERQIEKAAANKKRMRSSKDRRSADAIENARRDINLRLCSLLALARDMRDGRRVDVTVLDLLIEALDALTWDDVVRS